MWLIWTFSQRQPCISNWAYFLHVTHMYLLSTTALYEPLITLSMFVHTDWLLQAVLSFPTRLEWMFSSYTVFASSAWLYFLFKTRLEWMFFLVCASSAWLYFLFQQSLNECSLIICSSSAWLFLSLFERNAWMNVLYNLRKLSMTTVYFLFKQSLNECSL